MVCVGVVVGMKFGGGGQKSSDEITARLGCQARVNTSTSLPHKAHCSFPLWLYDTRQLV
jgi:ectoine hydroxylase-related dioxygenase (phytanoyl-CoA dioxygenase family)